MRKSKICNGNILALCAKWDSGVKNCVFDCHLISNPLKQHNRIRYTITKTGSASQQKTNSL